MNFKRIRIWVRRVWVAFGLTVMAILVWNVQAHGVPAALFESDRRLHAATTAYGRTFIPADGVAGAPALIFLPGGLIDPDAYVPLIRGVAARGIAAAIVALPMRAAPTAGMRATLWSRIHSAAGDLGAGRPVVLAGHSRGGMFAADFAADHPSAVGGLVLIGTTHPRARDLSAAAWPVLKVLGSADCVATVDAARRYASLLPETTRWVEIAGGNHRQFGYYGWQFNDCGAAISREEQHRQTIDAIVDFLTPLTSPKP